MWEHAKRNWGEHPGFIRRGEFEANVDGRSLQSSPPNVPLAYYLVSVPGRKRFGVMSYSTRTDRNGSRLERQNLFQSCSSVYLSDSAHHDREIKPLATEKICSDRNLKQHTYEATNTQVLRAASSVQQKWLNRAASRNDGACIVGIRQELSTTVAKKLFDSPKVSSCRKKWGCKGRRSLPTASLFSGVANVCRSVSW